MGSLAGAFRAENVVAGRRVSRVSDLGRRSSLCQNQSKNRQIKRKVTSDPVLNAIGVAEETRRIATQNAQFFFLLYNWIQRYYHQMVRATMAARGH
jgi:hypothetical protein